MNLFLILCIKLSKIMEIKLKKTAILLAIFLLPIFGCKPVDDKLSWNDNLDNALKIAAKENKTVLVNFTGSDWCIWCKKLNNEVFSKGDFAEYAAKKLVLVKIDFPRQKELPLETQNYNRSLAEKYGIAGFPTIALLKPDGSVIGFTGYQEGGAAAYVQHLKGIIAQG